MKKYSLISVLLIGMLLFWSIPGFAGYEQPISFSDISFYGADGVTSIDGPQAGKFFVSATAVYSGNDERTAYILCVFTDSAVGTIKEVSVSNKADWPGDVNQTLTAEVSLENIDGCDFNYYFIDDIGLHTPLANQPPGMPGDIELGDITVNSVDMSWEAADDDFQSVTGYEIYKNGAHVASTENTSYSLLNLMRNSENEIVVKSNDGVRLSNGVSAVVTPLAVKQLVFDVDKRDASFRVNESDNNLVLIAANMGAGRINASEVLAGRTCIEVEGTTATSGNTSVNGAYPGFTVNTDYITENDREIVFEFTYFDKTEEGRSTTTIHCQALTATGSGLRNPEIFNPDNPEEQTFWASKPVIVRNTGVWKTVTRTFSQAKYTEAGVDGNKTSGEFGKNFRLYSGNSGDFWLSSGCLYKKSDYVPMNPNMIVDGGMIVYDMNFTLAGGYDAAYQITEKDGITCAASTSAGNLAYAVTNTAVTNAASAKLEVSFYDDAAGDTLYVGSKAISMDGSGWREVALNVTGAELGAFELHTANGNTVYLKSIQAYAD